MLSINIRIQYSQFPSIISIINAFAFKFGAVYIETPSYLYKKKKQTILTPIWDDQQEDNYEFDKSKNYEEFYIIYFFVIKKKKMNEQKTQNSLSKQQNGIKCIFYIFQ